MYRSDDLDLLLPAFQPYARLILDDLRAWGHDPCPFDTRRTPEEAAKNHARGTGSKDSIHCYDAAMDVICNKHGWDCASHRCKFFVDYGKIVEARGMVWGGRFTKRLDLVHCQALEVKHQNMFRRLATRAERNAFIAARLCLPL